MNGFKLTFWTNHSFVVIGNQAFVRTKAIKGVYIGETDAMNTRIRMTRVNPWKWVYKHKDL